jgi:hypothetical protein
VPTWLRFQRRGLFSGCQWLLRIGFQLSNSRDWLPIVLRQEVAYLIAAFLVLEPDRADVIATVLVPDDEQEAVLDVRRVHFFQDGKFLGFGPGRAGRFGIFDNAICENEK